MGIEIERKFLVDYKNHPDFEKKADASYKIAQGYLNLDPEKTVRIRLAGTHAWITVKGINNGIQRSEFEYEIPYNDGSDMLKLCEGIITKKRYLIGFTDYIIEVDVFKGKNEGLIIAEVEFDENDGNADLPSDVMLSHLPNWITKEVSDDPRYYNSQLIQDPYTEWEYE